MIWTLMQHYDIPLPPSLCGGCGGAMELDETTTPPERYCTVCGATSPAPEDDDARTRATSPDRCPECGEPLCPGCDPLDDDEHEEP